MNILLIDNYDSFTYNLVQYFEEIAGVILIVIKNDQITSPHLDQAEKIVISPGPGLPDTNGKIIDIVRRFSGRKPILGVCLGMQAIYEAFGGKLTQLDRVYHGVTSEVTVVREDPVLAGLPAPFKAGRYHSWVCDPKYLPSDLMITAWDDDQEMMACRHITHPTFGVQFHPESFLTPEGKIIIKNFTEI